jgi:eukaryotic-like serine/threonine-protein kinase
MILGHYELGAQLGQGGMGVVYEALDQKLGRRVAIKLLNESARESSHAVERFWREARTASSLNHPGICTIYELNESTRPPFIVMELLEGKNLEKLCCGKALPYSRLIEVGIQLADGLDAAHRKGILHRDIKPANIFQTESGQVKLLDFGLAKLDEDTGGGQIVDGDSPTAAGPLTDRGSAVGTIAYMSPEQARGEPLDARSDIFSLGVVLYEIATGRHPFPGATTAVVFDKILNHAPVPPVTANPGLPIEFDHLLHKMLEKERELRSQSAAEVRADLMRLRRSSSAEGITAALPASRKNSWGLKTAFGMIAVLALACVAAWRFWPRSRPFESVSVNQITNLGTIEDVAFSSDGRFLAEVKNDNGVRTVWIRNIVTNTDTQILGAFANAYIGLTFSPDDNYLYFTRGTAEDNSERSLYAMPVFGGTPKQLVYDIDSAASFAPDGKRFTYVRWTPDRQDQLSELHIADKDGSNNQVLLTTQERIKCPVWSPDGRRIAWITQRSIKPQAPIEWIDLASKKVTVVPPPVHIVFSDNLLGSTSLAWLPDNRHLLTMYYKSSRAQIGVVDRTSGEFDTVTNDVNAYSQLALSGDGRRLATVLTSVESSIDYYKPDGGSPVATTPLRISPVSVAWTDEDRLLLIGSGIGLGALDRKTGNIQSFDLGSVGMGEWVTSCPDGHILFTGHANKRGEARLFRMNADGQEITQLTTTGIARAPFCSPDSKQAYFSLRSGTQVSMWVVPVAGGPPRQVFAPQSSESAAAISSDAKLAALRVAQVQKFTIDIFDLPSQHLLRTLALDESSVNHYPPRFAPDGRGLVYQALRNGGHTLIYQPLDGSPSRPTLAPVSESIPDFAWSPSGKELAVIHRKSTADIVLISDLDGKH